METTNPFPGMNPFMEQRWRDVRVRLIGFSLEALGSELPDNYTAIGEEHVNVTGGASRTYHPDVAIMEESWKRGLPPVWTPDHDAALESSVAKPVVVQVESVPERWVEVRNDNGELVTVIEIISPTNRDSGRGAYITKRNDLIAANVNIVEIDLLRAGRRLVDMDPYAYGEQFPDAGEHYTVCTTRAGFADRREIYICKLRERLPVIRIPLRLGDPDVPLDIQQMVDRCYATGRYWKLDYKRSLEPALPADDQNWISEKLRAAGLA
jgi:hypothetical protein